MLLVILTAVLALSIYRKRVIALLRYSLRLIARLGLTSSHCNALHRLSVAEEALYKISSNPQQDYNFLHGDECMRGHVIKIGRGLQQVKGQVAMCDNAGITHWRILAHTKTSTWFITLAISRELWGYVVTTLVWPLLNVRQRKIVSKFNRLLQKVRRIKDADRYTLVHQIQVNKSGRIKKRFEKIKHRWQQFGLSESMAYYL